MRAAERLVVAIAAASCCAWLHSPVRTAFRRVMRWHTSNLLAQIDSDAASLCVLRDISIPRAFRALAEEKHDLLSQLAAWSDGDAPIPVPRPDPAPTHAGGDLFSSNRSHQQ